MGRKFIRVLRDSCLDPGLHTILQIGLAAAGLQQCLDTAFLNCILVATERIPGQAHHLTGLRYIARFLVQMQQAILVLDDSRVGIEHEG